MAVATRRSGVTRQVVGAADRAGRSQDRIGRVLAVLVLGVLVALLAVTGHHRLTMPFGDSHDGRNAGVWAANSRSLRELGPIASRLGTWDPELDRVYANHPPLLVLEAAAAEALLGERPWVTRLPVWLGSMAAVVLSFLLLRECGLRMVAAAAGVAVAFGGQMFATYGAMLDTPVVGLPFGVAVLLVWQRARNGRPAPTWVVVLITALAVLASWLGLLVVGLVGVATLWPRLHRLRGPRQEEDGVAARGVSPKGFVVGGVAGAALVLAWVWWGYGSLGALADVFVERSGRARTDGMLIGTLRLFWSRLFSPWQLLLAIPGFVAAVQVRRTRAVTVVALTGVGIWVVGFRNGAVIHDYWAYWMVVPLALGVGTMADAVLGALPPGGEGAARRATPSPAAAQVALAAGAAFLAAMGSLGSSVPARLIDDGQDAGWLVATVTYPVGQHRAWVLSDLPEEVSWLAYGAHRPSAPLLQTEVERLAATAPDDLVLAAVNNGAPTAISASAQCLPAGSTRGRYALVPASVLAPALRPGCPERP